VILFLSRKVEMNATATVKRLSCAETAKLVRKVLKREFPGQKFSVRSHTYAGGASVSIGYTGGPCQRTVEDAVNWLQGCDFDGMIDLKTYRDAVLVANEDGSFEQIRSGANFIHAQRYIADDERDALIAEIAAIEGRELTGREAVGVYCDDDGSFTPLRGSTEWVHDLVYRASVRRAA
jgi:hypothetical protein